MAKPSHTRITYSGVFGTATTPVEHWSFNLCAPAAALAADASPATAAAQATAARGPFNTFMGANMGSDIVLTETRIASVNDAGLVNVRPDGSYVQGVNLTTSVGGAAKQPVPLQQALCISLTTGRAGPTGKGRFFLPWPAVSLDADDKRIPVAQVTPLLAAIQTWLQNLQTGIGAQLQVVSSKGYMSEVTGIRCGRVPDTMRSRREDSPEGYLLLPLA